MATTSACRVTSPSCVTLLIDSATIPPSRQITAAYGYSPTLPDDFERSMQWAIIRRSIVSTFIPTPDRVALQLQLSAENSFCSIGSRARILPPNHRRIISLAAILHSLCQKQTSNSECSMSAFPLTADIHQGDGYV